MFGFQELRDVWTNLPKHPLQVDNCKVFKFETVPKMGVAAIC